MSKSKGNVAYAEPIVKTLGNDALRYYLLREVVFGQDGNFSREALITRYNADLANGLGNLASRTLTMIERSFQGAIPPIEAPPESTLWSKDDLGVTLAKNHAPEAVQVAQAAFERFDFSAYVSAVWQLISQVDQFLAIAKPWSVKEQHDLQAILYRAAETLRIAVVLAHPVIPEATQKIWQQLGQSGKLEDVRIDQLEWGGLKPGTKIGKIEAVFPRADKKETLEKIETMENELRNPGSSAAEPKPSAPPTTEADVPTPSGAGAAAAAAPAASATAPAIPAKIGIEDFAKVELRVGLVKSAERIQGADKLLKLLVDIGDEVRQVLAGIAMGYTPEELVGRKVVVVTNLAPRKMRGLESNGMLLAASAGPDGKPILCTFAEDIPVGSKVK
jgi:methionyl-tRNA synthetase